VVTVRRPRIVLESDGAETVPSRPDAPRGAYSAARAAVDQGVSISTVSFGTPMGVVDVHGQTVPVPVDDTTLQRITDITGGTAYHAASQDQLEQVYASLQRVIGYETVPTDASLGWMRLGAFALAAAVLTAVFVNRVATG
jgi:Ca-activated chloride channel family protein